MLTFEGTDRSDLSVKGLITIFVLDDNDVKVYMEMDHVMLGHKKVEFKLKTGQLTADVVVKRLNEFVLGV
jgi:hypothetical protein